MEKCEVETLFKDEIKGVCNTANGKLNLLSKNPAGYVVMSFMAGMFIAVGCFLMGILGGVFNAAGAYSTRLINGLVFSVGLCLVTVAGGELFTGNNFVMAVAGFKKASSWRNIIKLWVVCYLGNLLGSVVSAVIFVLTGIPMADDAIGNNFATLAAGKIGGTPLNLFAKAILCNICVCLAIWCGAKLKSEGAKLAMIVGCVMAFVTCGFEHSVANMTFLTVGFLCPHEAVIGIGGILYNLGIVTIGNMVGGILFVAVPYCLISQDK